MTTSGAKTFIYIDVSNIRWACLWSCGFNLDFIKFYNYLMKKYPSTQEIRYYEGISTNDQKKRRHFEFLSEKIGYKVCSLERKSYTEPAKYKTFNCEKCKYPNKVQILGRNTKLKSNVDVYLASDLLTQVAKFKEPTHVIIVSCDGDYAETIKAALSINPETLITIMATPMTRHNNCLSSRLQVFSDRSHTNTALVNIASIKDLISQPRLN